MVSELCGGSCVVNMVILDKNVIVGRFTIWSWHGVRADTEIDANCMSLMPACADACIFASAVPLYSSSVIA